MSEVVTLREIAVPDGAADTYTVALTFGSVVIAADDFTEESFAAFRAKEKELVERRDVASSGLRDKGLTESARTQLVGEVESLIAEQTALWRGVCETQLKGVKAIDGKFTSVNEPDERALILGTVPARRALVSALSQRATFGASERDFLGE